MTYYKRNTIKLKIQLNRVLFGCIGKLKELLLKDFLRIPVVF